MSQINTLINDFLSLVKAGRNFDRNLEIFKSYYGFDTGFSISMEEAGKSYTVKKKNKEGLLIEKKGLTRESVRQILNKFKDSLIKESAMDKDGKFSLIKEIKEKMSSFSLSKVSEIAVALDCDEKDVINIFTVFDILQKEESKLKVIDFFDTKFLIPKEFKVKIDSIKSIITQEVSHNGAVSIDRIIDLSKLKKENYKFVKDLISCLPDIKEIPNCEDWYSYGDKGRNRLHNRLFKIFSSYSEVNEYDLYEALSRSWKKDKKHNTKMIPIEVVVQVCKMLNAKEIESPDGSNYISMDIHKKSSKYQEPGSVESKIIYELSNSKEGKLNEKELENKVLNGDDSYKYSFCMGLNHSPLLIRQSRGVYRLLK